MSTVGARTRAAVWALPLAGLVFVASVPLRGEASSAAVTDGADFAQQVTSAGHVAGNLGNIVAFALLLFAFIGLYGYFTARGRDRLATAALVSSVTGVALVLPLFGVVTFAQRALGQEYLDAPSEGLIAAANRLFTGPLMAVVGLGGSLYILGFILFAVAAWRTPPLPRWAAVLLVLAPPVLSRPPSLLVEVVASALLTAAGAGIAFAIRSDVARGAVAPAAATAAT